MTSKLLLSQRLLMSEKKTDEDKLVHLDWTYTTKSYTVMENNCIFETDILIFCL